MRHALYAAVAGLSFLFAGPALAHHAFNSEFDAQAPLTLTGAVTRVEWSDPHVKVHVDAKDQSGQTRNWSLELASPTMLTSKGWTKDSLKQGEVITVKGSGSCPTQVLPTTVQAALYRSGRNRQPC
jgi:hypothetical protein